MFENFILKHGHRNKSLLIFLSLAIFALLVSGFLFLFLSVAYKPTFKFDFLVLRNVQGISAPFLPEFMKIVSLFGEVYFAPITLALVVVLLFLKGFRKEAFIAPIILIGSLFTYYSKDLVARPRPTSLSLDFGYSVPTDSSFPSGHVVFYTLLFGLLAFLAVSLPNLSRIWRLILFCVSIFLVIFVGISRVYLGAHWPSDVIGGYLIGFALLEMLILAYLKFVYLPKVRNKQNYPDSDSKK